MHNNNFKYRPDIDGLRAIAVSTVVAFHAFPDLLPSGFIGVDIFFVISGYLISSILYKSLEDGSFSFADFYARRIKRIFPALILVLATCMVAGWYLLFPDEYKELGKHVAGGAGFVSNVVLWDESGYFDLAAEKKPLLHLWSLGVEEQFYFFWPLALWVAWRLRLHMFTLAIVAGYASFRLNVRGISEAPTSVFYMPYTRVWELLIGSTLAYAQLNYSAWFPRLSWLVDNTVGRVVLSEPPAKEGALVRNLLSLAGFAMLGYGLWVITKATPFPGKAALAPSLGAALIIAAGPTAWINRIILASKPFVWIGLISYPLYLWHWPLLAFARIVESQTPSLEVRAGAVVAAVVLAALTYWLLELPIRRSKGWYKVPVFATAMMALGCAGYFTFTKDGLTDRPMIQNSLAINSQFTGPLWKYATNETCLNRYKFKDAESYNWWFCATNKDAPPTVLLMGSSFANHLYPGFANQDSLRKQSVLSIGTCRVDITYTSDPNAPKTDSPCSGDRPYRQKLFIDSIVEGSKSVKYAILDGLTAKQESKSIESVRERIDYLEKHNIQVIVFKPHFTHESGDLKGCFARPLKAPAMSCDIEAGVRERMEAEFKPLVDRISKTNPNVKFFDQNDLLCRGNKCSLVLDGMPAFRDQYSHYSEYASNALGELFAKWARTNAPGILSGGVEDAVASETKSAAEAS